MTTATKYKPYPKYKSSGIDWLGDIPERWNLSKIKYVGDYLNGHPFKPEHWGMEGLEIIRIENLKDRESEVNYFAGQIDKKYLVKKDDYLISWSASLGIYIWNDENAWLNQHIFKVSPNSSLVDKKFYYWLAIWFISQLETLVHGSTMQHLTKDSFGTFVVYLPHLGDQHTIADFLDRETAKIDEVVAKKQKLMELLKEKRQALITHAVTKGLDRKAKMKPSGIDWLGDTPVGWEVKRLKYITQFKYGEALKDEDRISDGDFDVYGSNGIIGRHNLAITKNKTIVVGRKGSYGKITWVKQNCFPVDTTFYIDETATSNNLRWTYYLLLCIKLDEGSQDSAVPGLSREKAYNIFTPFLSINAQQAVADFLDRETTKIDEMMKKVETQIEKLQEYRQALIGNVVTGKIRI